MAQWGLTLKEPDDDTIAVFGFYPGVGYQFSKNRTAGITAGYGHEKFICMVV